MAEPERAALSVDQIMQLSAAHAEAPPTPLRASAIQPEAGHPWIVQIPGWHALPDAGWLSTCRKSRPAGGPDRLNDHRMGPLLEVV